jgi:hypothetical protein
MNAPLPDPDPLLDALYTEEELCELEGKSLDLMLATARRRRIRRRFIRGVGCTVVVALGLAILWLNLPQRAGQTRNEAAGHQRRTATGISASSTVPVADGGVKILSDAELLALFPDRPVAIIGTRSGKKLVFLDELAVLQPENRRKIHADL